MSDELEVASDAFQSLTCAACGRIFAQPNAYSMHIGSCRFQKKRMASALGVAKEKYRNKKSRRDVTPVQLPPSEPPTNQSNTVTEPDVEVSISVFYFTKINLNMLPYPGPALAEEGPRPGY